MSQRPLWVIHYSCFSPLDKTAHISQWAKVQTQGKTLVCFSLTTIGATTMTPSGETTFAYSSSKRPTHENRGPPTASVLEKQTDICIMLPLQQNQLPQIRSASSASSIYNPCDCCHTFNLSFSSFFSLPLPQYSAQGRDYLSTCVMETFPPWLRVPPCFHYNTTIHLPPTPYLDGVRGVRRASGGA